MAEKNVFYVATWFAPGIMVPQKKNFNDETEALDFWDGMAGEKDTSRISLDKIEVIRKGR